MARWHEVKQFVGRVFWPFRKSRITTLAALVVGLLRKQQVGLAGIAQGMLDRTTVKHRVKRVGRFLGNRAFRSWDVTKHLIETMMPTGHDHVVVVDWTDRGEYMLLKASLVYQRRALVLAWRHVWKGVFEKSQNAVEEDLILALAKLIGPKRSWVLVADRGFGRAELFRTLDEAGIGFVIRDADDVWVKTEGFEGRLWNLPRQRGKAGDGGELGRGGAGDGGDEEGRHQGEERSVSHGGSRGVGGRNQRVGARASCERHAGRP